MHTDLLRQVKTWLDDATKGVNALLASVPQDGGAPSLPAVTTFEASSTDWVMRGRIDRAKVGSGPVLIVQPADGDEATLQETGSEIPAHGMLSVVVRYATRKTGTASGYVQAWQTLRAAARSIHLQAARQTVTRNNVTIGPLLGMTYTTALDEEGDDMIVDSLTVVVGVVDAFAVAAT